MKKSGAKGSWVASFLTAISITVTIYFGCNSGEPKYKTSVDNILPLQIDSDAVKTDSDKIKVIGADGKPIDYSKDPTQPPPPPLPNYTKLDDDRILPQRRSQLKKMKRVKTYDCADSLDPLPPEKRTDTLNIENLPALQKQIEKNKKDSISKGNSDQ